MANDERSGRDSDVTLVTGAGRGIGLAIAQRAARRGDRLVLNDIDADALEAAADALLADGADVVVVAGDAADRDTCQRLVTHAAQHFGTISNVVNNAGVIRPGELETMPVDAWQRVLDVNLTAGFHLLQACAAVMLPRARNADPAVRSNGKVVNVASIDGLFGIEGQVNYGAAKAGVIGLTMSLAREWARHRINVNAVAPGGTRTAMSVGVFNNPAIYDRLTRQIPLRRWAEPDEIAGPVMFLTSADADYITGQTLSVCGGMRIAP